MDYSHEVLPHVTTTMKLNQYIKKCLKHSAKEPKEMLSAGRHDSENHGCHRLCTQTIISAVQ